MRRASSRTVPFSNLVLVGIVIDGPISRSNFCTFCTFVYFTPAVIDEPFRKEVGTGRYGASVLSKNIEK